MWPLILGRGFGVQGGRQLSEPGPQADPKKSFGPVLDLKPNAYLVMAHKKLNDMRKWSINIALVILLLALPGVAAGSSQGGAKQAVKQDDLILKHARKHSLPSSLLKAVVKTESNFNRWAVSPKGAKGLMQLMPEVCEQYGVTDPFDSEQNIRAGTTYLKDLLGQYHNLTLALAAYNAGPEAVDKHDGVPPYAETRAFIDSVYRYYNHFRRQIDPHAPQFTPIKPSRDQNGRLTVVIR